MRTCDEAAETAINLVLAFFFIYSVE